MPIFEEYGTLSYELTVKSSRNRFYGKYWHLAASAFTVSFYGGS